MSMTVVTKEQAGPLNGLGQIEHPYSPTAVMPHNRDTVAKAQEAAGGWARVAPEGAPSVPMRGLGQSGDNGDEGIPAWVWWLGGGLLLGGVAGAFYFR